MKTPEMGDDSPVDVFKTMSIVMAKIGDKKITPWELELFSQRKNPFVGHDDAIADWTQFYLDHLGLTVDLAGVVIPACWNDFDWVNIVAKEILAAAGDRPHGFVIEAMRRRNILVWTYGDLDKDIVANDRWPDKSYAVRNRDRVEADDENKSFSGNDLAGRGIAGSTCLERLLHGFKYFIKTGQHLDRENWTLCSGSHCVGGNSKRPPDYMPGIGFGKEICIGLFRKSDRRVSLRPRATIIVK